MSILQENKQTLVIFINGSMRVGGIETYIYKLAKDSINLNAYVMVFLHKKGVIDSVYDDLFSSESVYTYKGKIKLDKIRNVLKQKNITTIKVLSFNISQFLQAEKIKRSIRKLKIETFLLIPHFKGDFIYLEDNYRGWLKTIVHKFTTKLFNTMQEKQNILYFDQKHIDTFKERYNVIFASNKNYFVPSYKSNNPTFDEDRCIKLWERRKFNILSIARFEFPHKGYLLGLVRVFNELKKKYHFVTLTIGGYGPDQYILDAEISKLPEGIRKDIIQVGKVPPIKMKELYDDANLNVSVAGCYEQGVANGTLSIPARHYTYGCEVYGLSPEANKYSVSTENGTDAYSLIERVINMPKEEYVCACRTSYESMNTGDNGSSVFAIVNKSPKATLSIIDIIFIHTISAIKMVQIKIKLLKKRIIRTC